MHRINGKSVLASAVALASAVLSPVLLAETRMLEEVIVTAQKRAESAQDVPVALTAISSDMMEQLGITNTQDLVKLAPSLTVGLGDNKQSSGFRIRGIGTNVFSIGIEQSVAVIIDDVATVQAGQALSNLVDIERIEVLRGPQSTLFGKSASAGAISVVTKAPAEEFEGSVELTATDDEEQRVQASISGPISDDLGYRLTGYWSDYDGFVDNLTTGDKGNDSKAEGVRAKLRWDISDSVQADFTAYYSEEDSTCCVLTWLDLDPNAKVFGIVPGDIAPGIKPSDTNLDYRSDAGPIEYSDNSGANIRFAVDLGEFTLTSITAYDNWTYENVGDVDFSEVDIAGFFTGGALHGGFVSTSDTETDFYSQEFRLASPVHDNYDYLVGLYWAEADTDRSFLRNPDIPLLQSNWVATATTESLALFGQATWRFTDSTSITAGLRWNDEDISVDFVDNLNNPGVALKGDDSDSEVLGNLSLQHFLQEDVMLYARYAKGYKGQAYDISSGFSQYKADNPVAPETSDAFEIGIKSTLLDQRLQLNATAFYTEYQDYQAQSTEITPQGELLATINNVGELETQGLELDGVALIGENLTVTFGAAYIDATIKSFPGANCYPGQTLGEGCIDGTQDLSGGELPNSPEWKYSLAADYQHELGNMPFYGFFNLSYVWQDEVNFTLVQNPRSEHDSYGVANLSIGVNDKSNDRYRVTAFVNNLTDENFRSSVSDLSQLYGGATSMANIFSRSSQRYAGIRVKFNF